MKSWPLITSFVLFIALCVSAAYWAMLLLKSPQRPVIQPPQSTLSPPKLDAAAGLLGGRTSFAVASDYQLKGVVVASDPAESVAILSANGKPAQSVRINTEAAPGITVREVHKDYVLLSQGGAMKRVDLPKDPRRR